MQQDQTFINIVSINWPNRILILAEILETKILFIYLYYKNKYYESNCNMEIFKSLFEKIACKHQWKILARTEYADGFQYLFVCEKCGKMKKKWV